MVEYALLASCISAGCMMGLDALSGLAEAPLAELKSGITVHADTSVRSPLSEEQVIDLALSAFGIGQRPG